MQLLYRHILVFVFACLYKPLMGTGLRRRSHSISELKTLLSVFEITIRHNKILVAIAIWWFILNSADSIISDFLLTTLLTYL